MPFEGRLAIGLLLAIAMVYSATPLAIRVAARFDFYDKPAGYKGHARPTPYLGGLAVVFGFCAAMLVAGSSELDKTLPLLAGMAVLWVVGTIDDRLNISPWTRVAVEVGLGVFVWATGLGWDLGSGAALDLALTIFWLVAVINAFNLFDNMDGTASTMALAVSACVVALGLVQDNEWITLSAAALCGACIGFLPHNLASPARIFLGDGGSMPLGFAAATLVMSGAADAAPAWQSLVLGLLLVGVPATDTLLVILSRRRRGVAVLTGGQDHLTHRTRQWLPTARAVALALGSVQALVSAVAIFALQGGATVFLVIAVLYGAAMATAISFLEARYEDEAASAAPAGGLRPRLPRLRDVGSLQALHLALVVAFAGVAGASALSSGFYRPGQWVPIGLALITIATAGAIARPPRLSGAHAAGLVGLIGLGLWALVSSSWAPSIAQSVVEGNRWLVLGAIFALAVVLVRGDRSAGWMTGGLAAGTALVGAVVVVRMLGSGAGDLFLGGRLNEPLGYVNAQGTVFLMGFWLWFALAEQRRPWAAGAGMGVATALAGLALLSQSRGVALAALLAIPVVLLVVPGNRLRRLAALAFAAAGVFAASGPLLDVYPVGAAASANDAARALLLAALGAGAAWALAVWAHARVATRRPELVGRLPRLATIGLGALAAVAVVASIASAGRIADYASDQWDIFVQVGPAETAGAVATNDRLLSGAGNRYDYWRIAVDSFADRPFGGVGAGNYDRPYFQARRTSEDVRQPHSIELQALSETGLVGALLLAGLFVSLALAIARTRARSSVALSVAGVGVIVSWLVHTSVDWIHLFPGITAVALAMVAVLLRPQPRATPAPAPAPARPARRGRVVATAALAGLTLAVAVASLAREGLADLFLDRARDALADSRPDDAIREADRSLRLNAEQLSTYYVKAAALARFNRADDARDSLLRALSKERDNFVTWTLLGDLAVRRGRYDEAQRNYEQALSLNPEDAALRRLADDPRVALEPTG